MWSDFLRLGFVGRRGGESACYTYNIMIVLYGTGEPRMGVGVT